MFLWQSLRVPSSIRVFVLLLSAHLVSIHLYCCLSLSAKRSRGSGLAENAARSAHDRRRCLVTAAVREGLCTSGVYFLYRVLYIPGSEVIARRGRRCVGPLRKRQTYAPPSFPVRGGRWLRPIVDCVSRALAAQSAATEADRHADRLCAAAT